jgi:hypothetical protein
MNKPPIKLNLVKDDLFPLGEIVGTPAVLQKLSNLNQTVEEYLFRHEKGDWGELDPEDKERNDSAVSGYIDANTGKTIYSRILSSYELPDSTKLWIVTEADRSVTTLLLPEEY